MFEKNRLDRELDRLVYGPSPEEKPAGVGLVRFIANCAGDAVNIRERVALALNAVNRNSRDEWPTEDQWREILPDWLLDSCAPEETRDQVDAWLARWRQLSADEQLRAERDKPWSLSNLLYWLNPDRRHWYWWDSDIIDSTTLVIEVDVDDWPFAWGALSWVVRAAGAKDVEAEDS